MAIATMDQPQLVAGCALIRDVALATFVKKASNPIGFGHRYGQISRRRLNCHTISQSPRVHHSPQAGRALCVRAACGVIALCVFQNGCNAARTQLEVYRRGCRII